ncbi:Inner nuclear membrane protein Man1 [Blattella germanica]|nr:Inner nuclear membrane protein Man1 [Blattella germanica]
MTHQDAIKYLLKKDRPGTTTYLERYFRALKVLILSNPHWGISVIDIATGITGEDKSYHKNLVETGSLVVIEPGLPLLCYLKLVMFRILPLLGVIFFGFIGLFSARSATLWYLRRRERDKLDMFNLVEQIIDVLVRHQQAAPSPAPVYLPVNHVRDEIIPSTDRTRMTPLWDSAVKHIHENESRIRCDTQMHGGEEIAVWSWIPHAVYQKSPREVADNWPVRIEDAVLEKCEEQDVTAMHIYVDRSNRDGCVYLKCASQEDAGRAYRALHGWWFDSHLVTVKYLRLERYHERFPEAVDATIPLHPSNNQKLSLQWQGPLENN